MRLFRFQLSELWICLFSLLIALLVRTWLIFFAGGDMVDGDEALVGIQAQRILQGERPIYFYGQAYMGSLEAYLMALIFAVAGSSVWTLRMEPLLLSLVVVWLTYILARMLAKRANLSHSMRHTFITISTLMSAIAPLYFAVLELHTLGGYIELFILILLLLIVTLRLTQSWEEKRSWHISMWYWGLIGILLGLGFWVNPLVISTIVAIALWIAVHLFKHISDPGDSLSQIMKRGIKEILMATPLIPGFLLGSAPALYWGLQNNWQNVTYLFNRGTKFLPENVLYLIQYYVSCAAPRAISGALPDESLLLLALHTLPLLLGIFSIVFCTICIFRSFSKKNTLLPQTRQLAILPLLFIGCSALMFCIGNGPIFCPSDGLGRYVAPLALVLPFIVATTIVILKIHLTNQVSEQENTGYSSTTQSTYRTRMRKPSLWSRCLSIFFLLALSSQAASYFLTHPHSTFLYHSCVTAPIDNDPLIEYLEKENVRYAWAISWIGNPIIFETHGSITVADPRLVVGNAKGLGRVPEFVETVQKADKPALISFILQDDANPELLDTLNKAGVTYKTARFFARPGVDMLVAIPLNQSFSPSELDWSQTIFTPCATLLMEQ